MIPSIIVILIAFYWMMRETDYLRIRLSMGKVADKTLLLPASKPVLALPVGNLDNYPMTLTIDTDTLRKLIDQLSKTELELTEEVWGYDYSEQA